MQPVKKVDGKWVPDEYGAVIDRDDVFYLDEVKGWPSEEADVEGKTRTIYKAPGPGPADFALYPLEREET